MPRDFVHVSTLTECRGRGSSDGSLEGGPRVATIDDSCMSMIVAVAGKGGIDIQASTADSDSSTVKATDECKGIDS
jgi:hypothetical protein